MDYITPSQNRRLHQLLNQLGLMSDKASLIRSYSQIDSTSSKDLLQGEARMLIKHLEGLLPQQDDPADRMRKKMLMYGYEMDWDTPRTEQQKRMTRGARCFRNVDAWCRRYSKLKKGLNEHNEQELPALISQFEQLYKKQINKL
jgi:hypothetical protein